MSDLPTDLQKKYQEWLDVSKLSPLAHGAFLGANNFVLVDRRKTVNFQEGNAQWQNDIPHDKLILWEGITHLTPIRAVATLAHELVHNNTRDEGPAYAAQISVLIEVRNSHSVQLRQLEKDAQAGIDDAQAGIDDAQAGIDAIINSPKSMNSETAYEAGAGDEWGSYQEALKSGSAGQIYVARSKLVDKLNQRGREELEKMQ